LKLGTYMIQISTSNTESILPYLKQIHQPNADSHKGQNGKVLVVGGSSLFHGAVLYAAEAASHIVDMVHVASTDENNEIIKKIKIMWQGGIVVPQKDICHYASEDDTILVGNGMMRTEKSQQSAVSSQQKKLEEILEIKDEGEVTRELVYFLITQFPEKQFVFDAGAIQMMDPSWLTMLRKKAIITPHQKEFQALFGIDLHELPIEVKESLVAQKAKEFNCIILLKAIDDVVSDGEQTVRIIGGNAGLTKGGTGDVLAGLTAGMSATSPAFPSAVVASFLLKKTAEKLTETKGNWYTPTDILATFPNVYLSLI
jgi:ADP-dependent NAD(P)H-hydrate dehydratase / NAD(P)H-hydrate epimerase